MIPTILGIILIGAGMAGLGFLVAVVLGARDRGYWG